MTRLLAFLLGVMFASSAWAQSPGQPEAEVTIKLKMSQLAQIEDVLSKCAMPWTVSNDLLRTFVNQVDEQQKKFAEKPADIKP